MIKLFGFIGNLLGIGGDYLKNKQKLKELKQVQQHEIIQAETRAAVDRIMSNTQSDNEIDLITARNKRYTSKDEILTYLFLVPVVIATIVPIIVAYQSGDWIKLDEYFRDSYRSLDLLPNWYKYILGLIVIDVLGFRSFARKIIEKWRQEKSKE